MILPLTRPLVALDVETHDKCQPEQARIVEIGFHIEYPESSGKKPKRYVTFVNPGVTISSGATEVHHITNDQVADAPKFSDLAANLAKGFTNVDFCGYNIRFDLRVIQAEMARAGIEWTSFGAKLLDGLHLWRVSTPRTLSDAVREFLGREPTEAHRALGDAEDALDVSLAILGRFEKLPRDLTKLHDLCFDSNNVDPDGKFIWNNKGEVTCNFGKHKGTTLKAMSRGYIEWMISSDFTADVKKLLRDALEDKYPTRG